MPSVWGGQAGSKLLIQESHSSSDIGIDPDELQLDEEQVSTVLCARFLMAR